MTAVQRLMHLLRCPNVPIRGEDGILRQGARYFIATIYKQLEGVGADFAARAKTAGQMADRYADEGHKLAQLPPPVVEALHQEGLLGMWVPQSVSGGAELDPVTSLKVLESISYGDPS